MITAAMFVHRHATYFVKKLLSDFDRLIVSCNDAMPEGNWTCKFTLNFVVWATTNFLTLVHKLWVYQINHFSFLQTLKLGKYCSCFDPNLKRANFLLVSFDANFATSFFLPLPFFSIFHHFIISQFKEKFSIYIQRVFV